jgi:hypothetical protein
MGTKFGSNVTISITLVPRLQWVDAVEKGLVIVVEL